MDSTASDTDSVAPVALPAAQRRSERREVRNPVLGLPAARKLDELPDNSRAALRAVLLDLRRDAQARADKCWRTHKAPLALYWKCVAVYAGHIARVLAPAARLH